MTHTMWIHVLSFSHLPPERLVPGKAAAQASTCPGIPAFITEPDLHVKAVQICSVCRKMQRASKRLTGLASRNARFLLFITLNQNDSLGHQEVRGGEGRVE